MDQRTFCVAVGFRRRSANLRAANRFWGVMVDYESGPVPPEGMDVSRPAAARVYDWYLGGAHNFAADREFGARMVETLPMVKDCAQANRSFLHRAVGVLTARGIRQFLDIGSGMPTVGNVHEIAQQLHPEARTLYVDYERVAVAHANVILNQHDPHRERTAVLHADFRQPQAILDAAETRRLLDFSEPIGLLLVALMPFIDPADGPQALLRTYRDALPSGSYLAMSQITSEAVPPDMRDQVERFAAAYADTPNPVFLRSHQEFADLFDGFELIEPGVVWAPQWHPDHPDDVPNDPSRAVFLAGAGRKP
jgi:hypothetical protein